MKNPFGRKADLSWGSNQTSMGKRQPMGGGASPGGGQSIFRSTMNGTAMYTFSGSRTSVHWAVAEKENSDAPASRSPGVAEMIRVGSEGVSFDLAFPEVFYPSGRPEPTDGVAPEV